jgi:hypothetical protein
MTNVVMTSTPIRNLPTYRASTETANVIVSQAKRQGIAVEIRIVFRPITLLKYARGNTATMQPTDSIDTIQEPSSADIGMGESAASSLGSIGAVHDTPRPANVKDIDADGKETHRR